MGTLKSTAWEDRLLLTEPGELCELPNIVRYLVKNTSKTGQWNPKYAIAGLSKDMLEPNWEQTPTLIQELGEQAKNYRITAIQIKGICR